MKIAFEALVAHGNATDLYQIRASRSVAILLLGREIIALGDSPNSLEPSKQDQPPQIDLASRQFLVAGLVQSA